MKDPASGGEYYYNRLTGESTWDMPTEPQPAPAATATVTASAVSQRHEVRSMSSAMQVVEKPPAAAAKVAKAVLPAGWVAMVDEGSGTTYYFSPETGDVSWDPPTAAAVSAANPATAAAATAMTLEPLQRLPPG